VVAGAGVVVMVRVETLEGKVMVKALAVALSRLVRVVVIVVEGTLVTVKVAVGVFVTVAGGAAMISKDRM
jgi:hypothetical protein